MKSVNRFALLSLLALCALLVVGASPATARVNKSSSSQPQATFASGLSDGGRLTIKRSPILGDNVSFTIRVDGQIAGTSIRYRDFETFLAPGQHEIVATPNRLVGVWRGTLDVQAGKTYTYVAFINSDQLVLGRLLP
jgi:hypothetical protein